MIDFFRDKRVLIDIDGEGDPDDVFERVRSAAEAMDQREGATSGP